MGQDRQVTGTLQVLASPKGGQKTVGGAHRRNKKEGGKCRGPNSIVPREGSAGPKPDLWGRGPAWPPTQEELSRPAAGACGRGGMGKAKEDNKPAKIQSGSGPNRQAEPRGTDAVGLRGGTKMSGRVGGARGTRKPGGDQAAERTGRGGPAGREGEADREGLGKFRKRTI